MQDRHRSTIQRSNHSSPRAQVKTLNPTDIQLPAMTVLPRPRLLAHWQVIDGRLTCQWLVE